MTQCDRVCFRGRKINLSQVFAGQNVGIKQAADQIWLVSFMDYAARIPYRRYTRSYLEMK